MTAPRPLVLGDGWVQDTPGGLNRYVADLLAGGRVLGSTWRAVVVGPAVSAPVGVVAASRKGAWLPLRLLRLWAAARRGSRDADLLDAHFALYGLLPALTRGRGGLPLVVHFQGPWALESAYEGRRLLAAVRVKRLVENLVYRRADAFVVLTGAFRDELIDGYGVEPGRVFVIPPAVDTTRFEPGDRAEARRRLGLADVPTVVTVRRLVGRMGVEDLIQAWHEVQARHPDGQLIVVGDGPRRGELERQALRTGANIRFAGRVSEADLVDYYRASDVSVVPSAALEGFGLIVLESLACGTPVVVTSVAGLPEAVAGLEPPLIVPPGAPSALAATIGDVLADPRRGPSPTACRAHAERYSQVVMAEAHADLYTAVLRGRR